MLRSPWLPTWLVCCVVLPAQSRLFEPADLPARAKAAAAVQTLLAAPGAASATASGAAAAAAMLPEGSAARQRLDAALQAFHAQPAATATDTTLRLALDDLLEVLTFRPISQAPLPAGFPGFQVVDEIELRTYPKSRLVTTSLAGGSNRAFWPLFRHIEDNGIAMTTPVQMDWTPGTLTDSRPARMAFLYRPDPHHGLQQSDGAAGSALLRSAAADLEAPGQRCRRQPTLSSQAMGGPECR